MGDGHYLTCPHPNCKMRANEANIPSLTSSRYRRVVDQKRGHAHSQETARNAVRRTAAIQTRRTSRAVNAIQNFALNAMGFTGVLGYAPTALTLASLLSHVTLSVARAAILTSRNKEVVRT